MVILIIACGALALIGLVMLIFGVRGRRVGDHPVCLNCDFDLFGSDESKTCPECGSDVTNPDATAIGFKRKRPVLIIAGLTGFLFFALFTGGAIWQQTQQFPLWPYMPDAVLFWLIENPESLDELESRQMLRTLNKASTQRLVDVALAHQADRETPWDPRWADIIEQAIVDNDATDEQIDRYLINAVEIRLAVRDRVQVGRTPQMYFDKVDDSQRTGPEAILTYQVALETLTANGEELKVRQFPGNWTSRFFLRPNDNQLGRRPIQLYTAGQTPETVEFVSTARISIPIAKINSRTPEISREIVSDLRTFTATTKVEEQPTGNYVTDWRSPEEQAERAAIAFTPGYEGSEKLLTIVIREQPFTSRAKIYFRSGENIYEETYTNRDYELSLNHVHIRKTISDLASGFRGAKWLNDVKTFDVIIRPDIEEAERALNPPELWLGEWVFKGIPVDAEPADPNYYHYPAPLASLVPAEARILTLEEASQPPQ